MSNIKETYVTRHSNRSTVRFTVHKSVMPFKEVVAELTEDGIRVREALPLDNYPQTVHRTGTVYIGLEDPEDVEELIGKYEIKKDSDFIYLQKI